MRKLLSLTLMAIVLVLLGLSLIGCNGDEASQPSYSIDIDQRIFKSAKYNCVGCHTGASTAHLDLTSYEGLMSGESYNGPVVIPGDADNSLLYIKVARETQQIGERMPQGGPWLAIVDIRLIEDWINRGAKDN